MPVVPSTPGAIDTFRKRNILFAPAKAANAGGVAASGFEMAQNSARLSWGAEEVDERLHSIMRQIYESCSAAAEEYNFPGDLAVGANIAGFSRIAEAMLAQGVAYSGKPWKYKSPRREGFLAAENFLTFIIE